MRVESFKGALVATLIIVSLMSLALSQFTVSFSTSSYVSGSAWKQTDWVGGRENIGGQPKSDTWSDNYSGYYNGENENVKNSGEIRLENAIPNSYSWTQDSKADFDGGNKVNLDTSSFPGSVVLAGDNVTIGNTTNNAAQQPYAAFTYVQRLDPSGQYAAPSNGVIIQWRWNPMGPSNGAKLKIFRYVSGSVWTVIGESGLVNLINGMNTFSSYIPVKTGDRIGMYSGTNRTYYSDTSGYSVSRNQGEAPIYSTTSFTDHTQSRRIPIDAILKIYKYSGTLTSIVYDTQGPLTNWRIISWSGNLPPDTDITLQTRTGDTAIPDNTWSNYDWSDPVYTKSGTQITSRRARYIQYRVNFSTNDTSHTPFLDNVKITFITSGLYKPAGYVESSVYNAGIAVDWQNITWDAETPTLLGENKTVNNEPNPLVDWSQLIGENQSPLQNALTQDNVYEDIAESLRSPWWNRSWACRNPITINNENNPNSLENYQVKIDVNYDNSMFPNFDDLRFVDNDNLTQLNYWIENYTPGVKATVWVMVPKIPANASKMISMFYGNPGANPASNFSATFPNALIIDGTNKTLGDVQKYDWVEIKNSGILIMQSENILQLFARKIVVDSTSFIYAIGSGFAGGPTSRQHGRQENGWSYDGRPGTGGGTGGYASTASDGPGGGGGTYGGIGGNGGGAQGTGDQPGVGASTTFGSDNDNIVYMGSGGGAGGLSAYAPENDPWNAGGAGGGGGGAVRLNAGIIVISGMVFANGGNGAAGLSTTSGTGGGGGGSGGTIIIEGKKVTITGTLSANGGTGGARSETLGGGTTGGAGGGGGGGKIKIFYDNSLDNASANESVAGGSSGGVSYEAPVAQPGTSGNIYTEKISYQEPTTSVGTKELESADRGQQTYYLNWEHRITGVSPGYDNYTLHIWGYSDGDLEDIGVYIWMSKTNSWSFVGNLPKVPGTQITFSIQPKNLDDYVVGDNISIGYSDNAGDPTRTIIHIDYISLECTGNKPYTTSANVFTRTGNTANPDISWSGWQEADNNGPVPSPNATLYIQYRVELSTLNGKISPVFKEIILDYSIIRGVHVWISPGENSGLPGEDVNYLVLIQNVGENLIDNYVLTVDDNANWSQILDDNFFGNVAPGENRTTTLRVAVPGNAIGGTIDEITVTATAQTDNTVSGSNNCTAQATILRKFHVDISPSSQENVNGGTLAYTVSVYNTGNVPENFLLTEGDNAGWTPSLDNTWILVPNGGTGTITLRVTISSNATGSTWDNIWVQATSKDNLAVFDNESCTGQVTISRGVSVSILPDSQNGANGSTLNYTVTVSNPGNVSDNYSLTPSDTARWAPSVLPTSIVVPAFSSDNTTTLSVTIPSGAVGGTIDNLTVTANGTGDSGSASCLAESTGVVYSLQLVMGWNLVSFPIDNSPTTPNRIFTGLTYLTDYIIYSWTAPAGPYLLVGATDNLKDNLGYWVDLIATSRTITWNGTQPVSENIHLIAGWNLVSFPVVNENTTPNKIITGLTYLTDFIIYSWSAPSGPYMLQEVSTAFKDNTGYWVWIDQDWAVTVPSGGGPSGLSVYSRSQSWEIPSEWLENIPASVEFAGYIVSGASAQEILDWYKGQMTGWTLLSGLNSSFYAGMTTGFLFYRKGNVGAVIVVYSGEISGTTLPGTTLPDPCYVLATGPLSYLASSAGGPSVNAELAWGAADNSVELDVFTIFNTGIGVDPSATIPATDWQYKIWEQGATEPSNWTAGPAAMAFGAKITLATGQQSGFYNVSIMERPTCFILPYVLTLSQPLGQ